MASAPVRAQLNDLVSSMFAMTLQDLEDGSSPSFLAQFIPLFRKQFGEHLFQVSKLLDNPVVDFPKVDAYLHKLLEDSSHMGAKRVTLACNKFCTVCKENDKKGCLTVMHEVRREFDELYKKLQAMLELKEQIQALDTKKIIGVSKL